MSDISDIRKPMNYPIITGRPGGAQTPASGAPPKAGGNSFGEVLQKTIERQNAPQQLTFSKHAQTRTLQRGIELSETDLDRLTDAVGRAGDKGVTDTLVLMNNTAFIVNVPSRVVVTVVDGSDTGNNVFTNINGAVIV